MTGRGGSCYNECMSHPPTIEVTQVDHHRNGVAGEPFYVVMFGWTDKGAGFNGGDLDRRRVATVFRDSGEIAVLDLALLLEVGGRFGKNSWRSDEFEEQVRTAIRDYEARESNYETLAGFEWPTTPRKYEYA